MGSRYHLRRVQVPQNAGNSQDIVQLDKDVVRFGRNPDQVDVTLNSFFYPNMISRNHAEIRKQRNEDGSTGFYVLDRSLNGTYVNGYRVQGEILLHPGDSINFGHVNGAAIPPGKHAPQPDAEFTYVFEKVNRAPGSTSGTPVLSSAATNQDPASTAASYGSAAASTSATTPMPISQPHPSVIQQVASGQFNPYAAAASNDSGQSAVQSSMGGGQQNFNSQHAGRNALSSGSASAISNYQRLAAAGAASSNQALAAQFGFGYTNPTAYLQHITAANLFRQQAVNRHMPAWMAAYPSHPGLAPNSMAAAFGPSAAAQYMQQHPAAAASAAALSAGGRNASTPQSGSSANSAAAANLLYQQYPYSGMMQAPPSAHTGSNQYGSFDSSGLASVAGGALSSGYGQSSSSQSNWNSSAALSVGAGHQQAVTTTAVPLLTSNVHGFAIPSSSANPSSVQQSPQQQQQPNHELRQQRNPQGSAGLGSNSAAASGTSATTGGGGTYQSQQQQPTPASSTAVRGQASPATAPTVHPQGTPTRSPAAAAHHVPYSSPHSVGSTGPMTAHHGSTLQTQVNQQQRPTVAATSSGPLSAPSYMAKDDSVSGLLSPKEQPPAKDSTSLKMECDSSVPSPPAIGQRNRPDQDSEEAQELNSELVRLAASCVPGDSPVDNFNLANSPPPQEPQKSWHESLTRKVDSPSPVAAKPSSPKRSIIDDDSPPPEPRPPPASRLPPRKRKSNELSRLLHDITSHPGVFNRQATLKSTAKVRKQSEGSADEHSSDSDHVPPAKIAKSPPPAPPPPPAKVEDERAVAPASGASSPSSPSSPHSTRQNSSVVAAVAAKRGRGGGPARARKSVPSRAKSKERGGRWVPVSAKKDTSSSSESSSDSDDDVSASKKSPKMTSPPARGSKIDASSTLGSRRFKKTPRGRVKQRGRRKTHPGSGSVPPRSRSSSISPVRTEITTTNNKPNRGSAVAGGKTRGLRGGARTRGRGRSRPPKTGRRDALPGEGEGGVSLHDPTQGCGAKGNCLKPDSDVINWVQCDDCDTWFHTDCVGYQFDEVTGDDTAFHCGCL